MENFDQPLEMGMAPGKDDGLQITQGVRQHWQEISKWALFFAVLLFIVFGLIGLVGLRIIFIGGAVGIVSGLFALGLYAVVFLLPGIYYFRFYTQMKQALRYDDTTLLDMAFVNLKRFYRYVGILVIVSLALVLLMLLIFGAVYSNRANGGFPME